jgi:TRAP-type C4-dicarboxylate transport system permease large subunit
LTYIPSQVLQIVGRLALAAKDAALPLMIPVILLGGILTGWFTPTEAGVVAVV